MTNRPRQNGVVLISVLWVVAALSMMVASSLVEVRTDTQLTHTHAKMVQARSLAEAGIYWAIHALLRPRQSVQPGLPDKPVKLVWGKARIDIWIENEAGKIDVNTATPRLIENALVHAGMDQAEAQSLSRRHERDRHAAPLSGQPDQPFKTGFHSVEEFTGRLGTPRENINRLIPWLTVYNGREGINPSAASRDILSIVPGVTENQVEAYLKQRARWPLRAPEMGSSNRFFSDRLSPVYTITAHVSTDGVTTTIGSIVRLSALRDRPYEILQWRTSRGFEAG